ncbi:hypothetical protein Y032_0026g1454 [Ancylostoma ceylanicum]|uniref:Uncharacterized protein n=1 Tax=Ancylostoma ceylanicum TaxID=53326 RepID=A0A016UUQ9_9BILA|nr:hypothetical protein Y032_0026g1454 [Ancylostoma ceylanicum]
MFHVEYSTLCRRRSCDSDFDGYRLLLGRAAATPAMLLRRLFLSDLVSLTMVTQGAILRISAVYSLKLKFYIVFPGRTECKLLNSTYNLLVPRWRTGAPLVITRSAGCVTAANQLSIDRQQDATRDSERCATTELTN